MTTMLETLDETTTAYTRITRAARTSGGCYYYMEGGRMCAVGRCMSKPQMFAHNGSRACELNLDPLLKPEYRGFPDDFWNKLQELHDESDNWDSDGLTKAGRDVVLDIKEYINDNDA